MNMQSSNKIYTVFIWAAANAEATIRETLSGAVVAGPRTVLEFSCMQ
jgi:hypothetical protein